MAGCWVCWERAISDSIDGGGRVPDLYRAYRDAEDKQPTHVPEPTRPGAAHAPR